MKFFRIIQCGWAWSSGAETILPVPGASKLMGYGYNDNFFLELPDDDIEWKVFEDKSFSSAGA